MCFAPGAFQSKVPATLGCDDQAWPTLMGESGVASLARLETLCDACGKCDPATDIRRGTRRGNQPEPRPPNRTLWPPSGNASASYTGLTNTTVRNTWRGIGVIQGPVNLNPDPRGTSLGFFRKAGPRHRNNAPASSCRVYCPTREDQFRFLNFKTGRSNHSATVPTFEMSWVLARRREHFAPSATQPLILCLRPPIPQSGPNRRPVGCTAIRPSASCDLNAKCDNMQHDISGLRVLYAGTC